MEVHWWLCLCLCCSSTNPCPCYMCVCRCLYQFPSYWFSVQVVCSTGIMKKLVKKGEGTAKPPSKAETTGICTGLHVDSPIISPPFPPRKNERNVDLCINWLGSFLDHFVLNLSASPPPIQCIIPAGCWTTQNLIPHVTVMNLSHSSLGKVKSESPSAVTPCQDPAQDLPSCRKCDQSMGQRRGNNEEG